MITPSRHITSLIAGVTLLFSIAAGAAGEASADASAEEYERGFQALEAGKFDEALYYISLYAANGDPRAQYTMGVMHRKGAGGPGRPRSPAVVSRGSRIRSHAWAICSGSGI